MCLKLINYKKSCLRDAVTLVLLPPMVPPIEFWHPVVNKVRRGCSASSNTFTREALGRPIRSKHPYAFANSLLHQNELVIM